MNVSALHWLHRHGKLRNVDIAFAKLLGRLDADALVQLAGALAMRAVSLGHGGFSLENAGELLRELGADIALPEAGQWAQALQQSPLVGNNAATPLPLTFEFGRIGLRRYAHYEAELARMISQRAMPDAAGKTTPLDAAQAQNLRRLFGLPSAELDRQALAAWLALRQRLLLVTGGPGTGKTTTVARMLALLLADPNTRIALAAPTGRAASRLGEAIDAALRRDVQSGRLDQTLAQRIPRNAQTLHRLLGWRSGQVGFRHNADNPLPFDIIVVDEASMIDLPLMAKLVAAVREDAKLILLGDPDQLPAVEAGNVLGALCDAAGNGLGLPLSLAQAAASDLLASVPLENSSCGLSAHRVHLQRGYRQAGAMPLAALAQAIRQGHAETALSLLNGGGTQLQWRNGDAAKLESAVSAFALTNYRHMIAAPNPQTALQLAARTRILTALRKGPFGAQMWNEWFARQLADDATASWFHGRLVMIAANSYRHNLFNGDTGIAWRDKNGDIAVWFEHHNSAWRPSQLPAHESAFASTVHKAQGSEFDRVALLLPDDDARTLNRELVYTALTRARQEILLWSTPQRLQQTIARRTWRDSGLAMRLNRLPSGRGS
jgi:exodeoxyribonuclease V alpha subunit